MFPFEAGKKEGTSNGWLASALGHPQEAQPVHVAVQIQRKRIAIHGSNSDSRWLVDGSGDMW